ncbi:MAG TPA: hypothetical protein VMT59_09630 [Gaiellaceae bacterium]|nr:hypothetical protein [Gaiellaceae bacterium]
MTVRAALIGSVIAALLAVASPGLAATRDTVPAPTGLHAFLLRVDEPATSVFPRTPSFAWSPVPAAVHYEFQLSTSESFRENGIVYSDQSLTSPVAAPALTLPWITGTPHSLYARVRAVLADTTTDWSAPFGFDMQPPNPPTPLPSYPGLLRWTPVDGAAGYEVWFVDIPKFIISTTNVADEREFYTFHQAASWLSTVRWRIRAIRNDFNKRANGLPAVSYGPWSPVYSSVNPPFAVGPLKPLETVSDVVSNGAASAPAQRLMPAFVYGGNQSFQNVAQELYRVYVFTDRGCLNRVFVGSIVGSPAYAPRFTGPLALPNVVASIPSARNHYLPDGPDGTSTTWDGETVTANEALPDVTATTGLPAGTTTSTTPATPTTPSTPSAPAAPAAPAAPSSGTSSSSSEVPLLTLSGKMGPPTDLWDTDWSHGGGYYWTVVPVAADAPDSLTTTIAGPVNGATIPVADASGFTTGDSVMIGNPGNTEPAVVASVAPNALTLSSNPKLFHFAGEPVTRVAGTIRYTDVELAQDVCAAGRVMRFGKESEPALTASGELFATGLSPLGKLASASDTRSFYGAPLVAWTSALGAEIYEVQWSKTKVPFTPETDPATGALGMLTLNNSEVLPLTTGTWYFRVRGFNYSLPTGAQAMSWSDPQQIVVSKPTFTIVGGTATIGTTSYRVSAGGFSVSVPSTWAGVDRHSAGAALKTKPALVAYLGPKLKSLASGGSSLRFVAYDPSGSSVSTALVVQATSDPSYTHSAWVQKMTRQAGTLGSSVRCAQVSLPAGPSLRCTYTGKAQGRTESAVVYFLQHRGATYSLTFTSSPGAAHAKAPVFSRAARSFRFTS